MLSTTLQSVMPASAKKGSFWTWRPDARMSGSMIKTQIINSSRAAGIKGRAGKLIGSKGWFRCKTILSNYRLKRMLRVESVMNLLLISSVQIIEMGSLHLLVLLLQLTSGGLP